MNEHEETTPGAPPETYALWGVLCGLLLGLAAITGLSWLTWLTLLPGVALFGLATVVIGWLAVWVLPVVAVHLADRMDGDPR